MRVWDPRDPSPTSPERVQISPKMVKMSNILLFPVLCNFCVTLTPHLLQLSVEEEEQLDNGGLGP